MTMTDPPRWAERALALILKPRDRQTIAGDLLEEYREAILPARGRPRAQLWYLVQIVSLMSHVQLGVALGLGFSTVAVLFNVAFPLAHLSVPEPPYANAFGFGGVFMLFGATGYLAHRRRGDVSASAITGGVVAAVSMFLLMATFSVIHAFSIRAFAPLPAFAIVGAFCGALGGFASRLVSAIR